MEGGIQWFPYGPDADPAIIDWPCRQVLTEETRVREEPKNPPGPEE